MKLKSLSQNSELCISQSALFSCILQIYQYILCRYGMLSIMVLIYSHKNAKLKLRYLQLCTKVVF